MPTGTVVCKRERRRGVAASPFWAARCATSADREWTTPALGRTDGDRGLLSSPLWEPAAMYPLLALLLVTIVIVIVIVVVVGVRSRRR
jgi:hypothetical protein